MRQFILAGNVAYTAATDFNAIAEGAVGFYYLDNGVPTVTATGEEILNRANLVLGRTVDHGGPVVLPIYKNHFSFVRGDYQAATTFAGTMVISAPTQIGDYTIIVVKKGIKFNERSKWTANVYVDDTSITAAALAQKLADAINSQTVSSGLYATVAGATITFSADNTVTTPAEAAYAAGAGFDYAIVPADGLRNVVPTITTQGKPAYGDAAYITDLANRAAADAGFEYTYYDTFRVLYPNYPLNPLVQPNSANAGFTIFTMRFAEPRDMKTRDDIVHQIVQVAFPTGAAAIATFETVLESLAGIEP